MRSAVAALGYQPNLLARSMARQKTQTLGMIVPDIANPFFPEVVRGAEDVAHTAGYTLLISSSDNDVRKEEVYLRLFLAKRVDGVILTKAPGRMPPELRRAFAKAGVPVVLLARTVTGFVTDAVELDDRGAAYDGVTHLLRLGYRRVGFVGGLRGASTSRNRLAGYKAALRDSKVPLEPSLVTEGDFRVESGYRAGLELLKSRPDAVFIANYLMTVGFMEALRQYQHALSGGCCPRHLRRLPLDGLVFAEADDHRPAETRARRSGGAAPGRADLRRGKRPRANHQAEERAPRS